MNSIMLAMGGLLPCLLGIFIIALALRQTTNEPFRNTAFTIFCGLLTVPVAIAMAIAFDQFTYRFAGASIAFGIYDAVVVAALAEETARAILLWIRLGFARRNLSSKYCLLNGAIVGLAFASVENTGYCIDRGWSAVWERAITSVPLHALAGAIVGYAVGYALSRKKSFWILVGVGFTTLVHGFNNFNFKLLYSADSPGDAPMLPESGIAAMIVSGWPSNIFALLLLAGAVFCLARYGRFDVVDRE